MEIRTLVLALKGLRPKTIDAWGELGSLHISEALAEKLGEALGEWIKTVAFF